MLAPESSALFLCFGALTTARMSGKAAGAAIALVNSVGAVGAFTGPSLMGWLHDATRTYSAGLWVVAVSMALAAIAAPGGILTQRSQVVEETARTHAIL